MSSIAEMSMAPENGDEQVGFDKAFMIMSMYWTVLNERFTDPHELVLQFDSFMLGVQAKLAGYSTEESARLVDDIRKEDGLFGNPPVS